MREACALLFFFAVVQNQVFFLKPVACLANGSEKYPFSLFQ